MTRCVQMAVFGSKPKLRCCGERWIDTWEFFKGCLKSTPYLWQCHSKARPRSCGGKPQHVGSATATPAGTWVYTASCSGLRMLVRRRTTFHWERLPLSHLFGYLDKHHSPGALFQTMSNSQILNWVFLSWWGDKDRYFRLPSETCSE